MSQPYRVKFQSVLKGRQLYQVGEVVELDEADALTMADNVEPVKPPAPTPAHEPSPAHERKHVEPETPLPLPPSKKHR